MWVLTPIYSLYSIYDEATSIMRVLTPIYSLYSVYGEATSIMRVLTPIVCVKMIHLPVEGEHEICPLIIRNHTLVIH